MLRVCLKSPFFLNLGKRRRILLASVDSTGFESNHISQYFYRQRKHQFTVRNEGVFRKYFPKLSLIVECSSHLVLSAFGSRGPRPDIAQLHKSLKYLPEKLSIRTLLTDAGYDSEANHERIRERGCRSIIPPWHGRRSSFPAKGKWRRKMFFRFKKTVPKTYKQRWQVETTFSMLKRNLSSSLTARSYRSQSR